MGYCMEKTDAQFRIKQENVLPALQAVKALAAQVNELGTGGSYQGGRVLSKHYAFVRMDELARARTLHDALVAWRWNPVSEDAPSQGETLGLVVEPGYVDIEFEGEKLGDDEVLFSALAPFVEPGSYIEMEGEDGYHWRWKFEDGQVREVAGKVTYEEDDEEDA